MAEPKAGPATKESPFKFDLADIILIVLGFFGGEAAAHIEDKKDKIISSLTAFFSKKDEGIWAALLTLLPSAAAREAVHQVMAGFKDDGERDALRLSIVNMPNPENSTVEFTDKDTRVLFLKNLADLVNGNPATTPAAVCEMLRTQRLANEGKLARFINNPKETARSARKIAKKITGGKTEKELKARINRGFWLSWWYDARVSLIVFGTIAALIPLVVISGATYSWIQTLPPWIGIIIMGVVVLVVSIIVAYKRK